MTSCCSPPAPSSAPGRGIPVAHRRHRPARSPTTRCSPPPRPPPSRRTSTPTTPPSAPSPTRRARLSWTPTPCCATSPTSGIRVGGISYSSAFLTGGVFGYDGVHPTPFGYAYIANLFIDAINATYGGDIPEVDLYPFVFGPLPSATAAISTGKASGDFTNYVFTSEARRNLLLSLNVPKWIVDGTKPPHKPRHPRG